MKTGVVITERVALTAKGLAKRLRIPVSKLYRKAIEEFVSKHDREGITESLNKVFSEDIETEAEKKFRNTAAKQSLRRTEW